MRTLLEIVELIKDGGEPTREELYYSVLALEALHAFDSMDFRKMLENPNSKFITPEYIANEQFNRSKRAFQKSPKEWVGWNNDPHNPERQKERKFHKKLLDKVLEGAKNNDAE
jgi:hypothetical protein